MLRSLRRRLPPALRAFVFALLALGLLLKPVLAAAGELHELGHDPSGTHALAGHDDHVSGDDAPDVDEADPLHALIHFAHCCGQSSVAFMPAVAAVAAPSGAANVLMREPQLPPHIPLMAPFRPPIAT